MLNLKPFIMYIYKIEVISRDVRKSVYTLCRNTSETLFEHIAFQDKSRCD